MADLGPKTPDEAHAAFWDVCRNLGIEMTDAVRANPRPKDDDSFKISRAKELWRRYLQLKCGVVFNEGEGIHQPV